MKYLKYLFNFIIINVIYLNLILNFAFGIESQFNNGILHEADSIYNHITVKQNYDERCMLFGRYRDHRETCIKLTEPDYPIFEYTSTIFVSLLFYPEAKNIALLGLGGGYIPLIFRLYLPSLKLDVVEVDPMVEELAKKYFDFVTNKNINLYICDGRQFLKKNTIKYDHIWVDTFNSDYIPTHLTTKEFLLLAKSRLTNHGILVQNIHTSNRLYDAHIVTFRAVFKNVFVFSCTRSANAILIGADNPIVMPSGLNHQLKHFKGKIGKIDLLEQINKFNPHPMITESKILTDDYAPANLLIHQK